MGILKGPIAFALVKLVMDPTDYVNSIAKIKSTLLPLAALTGAAFAIGGLVRFGKAAAQVASDFNEIRNRFDVTFDGIRDKAENTANTIAKEFDLAGGTIREILAATGTMAVGLGYTRKEALKMAAVVARLSGDLASYQDVVGGATEANKRLQSLLMGNMRAARESLRIFVIQDAAFKKRVKLLMRTKKLTEEQAKVEVRLEKAYQRSILAIGDYERTRQTYANQIRANAEANKEFLEVSGTIYRRMVEASDGIGIWTRYLRRWGDEIKAVAKDRTFEMWAIGITQMVRSMINIMAGIINTIIEPIKAIALAFWGAWTSIYKIYVKLFTLDFKGLFESIKTAAYESLVKPWKSWSNSVKKHVHDAFKISWDAEKSYRKIYEEGAKAITDAELRKTNAIDKTTKTMKSQMFGAENLREKMQQTFLGNTKAEEVLGGVNKNTMPSRSEINPRSTIMNQIKTALNGIKEVGEETNTILEQRERHDGYAYGVVQ